jgi:hypothetical protein
LAAGLTLGTAKIDNTWARRLPSMVQGNFSIICIIIILSCERIEQSVTHEKLSRVRYTNLNSPVFPAIHLSTFTAHPRDDHYVTP